MAQTLPSLGYVQILVKNVFPLFSNTFAKLDPQKTIGSRTFWDVFFQTLTLGIVSTNRQTSSKGFTLQHCRVSPCVQASHVGHVVGVDVCFFFAEEQ